MKLGLVLGGGLGKGAFQLGALKALAEVFPPETFSCISTSSIGIMNGLAFVTGQLAEAEYIWTHIEFNGMHGFAKFVRKPDYYERMFSRIRELRIPIPAFYSSYLAIPKPKLHYVNLAEMEEGQYSDYLRAGVAMPPFCRPVPVNGVKGIDGAVVDNIPVLPVLEHDCDYIIAIYFDEDDYRFVSPEVDRKVLRLNIMDEGIIKGTFCFDREYVDSLLEKGAEACRKKLEAWEPLIRSGEPIPADYAAGTAGKRKSMWYTGDMLLNRVNTATKKVAGYQIDRTETKE